MSVTLTKAPAKISFSQNEIQLQVTSDDYIDQDGIKATFQMLFKAAVPVGHQTRIVWANGDVTLVAAGDPDDSGTQIPAGDGSAAHVQNVLAVIKDNPYLDSDFEMSFVATGNGPAINFTALQTGQIFNVANVNDAVISVTRVSTGIDENLKSNMAIYLQLWLKAGAAFQKIFTSSLILDNPVTGVATKDLSDIIHSYLVPGFYNDNGSDRPIIGEAIWRACTNTLLEYYVRFAEVYGDIPQIKKLHSSDHFFVNIGGLDTQNVLNQTLAGFLMPGAANSKTLCLRQGSKLKTVQLDQPEFLYWINLTGNDIVIQLRVDVYYADGDKSTFKIPSINALAWNKYYIATGYNALNINLNLRAGKSCVKYVATVTDLAGNILSVGYTYQLDTYSEWTKYFIYRNSLGGFQTIYTYGKSQPETTITKEVVKKQVSQVTAAAIGNMVDDNIRLQKKTTTNTGYISARDVANLADFFVSEEKYLVSGDRLIPITITDDSLKQGMDGDNLNAGQFTYVTKFDDNLFTDNNTDVDNPDTADGSGSGPTVYNVIIDNGQFDNVYIPQQ